MGMSLETIVELPPAEFGPIFFKWPVFIFQIVNIRLHVALARYTLKSSTPENSFYHQH